MKKLLTVLLSLMMILGLVTGCAKEKDDIIILFTNDVHCGIDDNIGYAGLAAYKKEMQAISKNVTLVDSGDFSDGGYIASVNNGLYLTDIMNKVGYDYTTLGNHEFGGWEHTGALIDSLNAKVVVSTITYDGTGENGLKNTSQYEIKDYDGVKVAFIGLNTPETITKSVPTIFQENGVFTYNFHNASGEAYYAQVQSVVDAARAAGAQYVIALAHLGDDESASPFCSTEVAVNTSGIDAFLDGHSHSTIPTGVYENKEGKSTIIVSTGTKLSAIGKLVISTDGNVYAGIVTNYQAKDAEVDAYIKDIQASYEAEAAKVVATSNTALSISNEAGIRLVRTRETAIGDMCADAYVYASDADIAFVNGGGIRADLPEGDITYTNIIAVHPFGNSLCVAEATGQEIVDALEWGTRLMEKENVVDGVAKGECGGFPQVSGIKFTVDLSKKANIEVDEGGSFVAVTGDRRVSDVQVLNKTTGAYEPIDLTKTYQFACHNYLIKSGGDGYTMFMDNNLLVDEAMFDYQVLINYITKGLNGDLSKYAQVDSRISIK